MTPDRNNSNASWGGMGLGGGIFNLNGRVRISRSTFAGNSVEGGLGGDDGQQPAEAHGAAVYSVFLGDGVGNSLLLAAAATTLRLEDSVLAQKRRRQRLSERHRDGADDGRRERRGEP